MTTDQWAYQTFDHVRKLIGAVEKDDKWAYQTFDHVRQLIGADDKDD
jgi:hypothetical protein